MCYLPYFKSFDCYVEPFGGSAAVLFDLAEELLRLGKKILYNDKDPHVVNSFNVVVEQPQELITECRKKPNSETKWKEANSVFAGKTKEMPEWYKDPVKQAAMFLFWHNASRDGAATWFKGNLWGGRWFNEEKILRVSKILRNPNVTIMNRDFKYVIQHCDSPRALFLLDPPYDGLDYYPIKFRDDERIALFDMLKNIESTFLLTERATDKIRELYKGYSIDPITRGNVEHLAIRNYSNIVFHNELSAPRMHTAYEKSQLTEF